MIKKMKMELPLLQFAKHILELESQAYTENSIEVTIETREDDGVQFLSISWLQG